ncbi:hypothetical protein FMEXI_12841 [Fusarium mexicanum]|uniref:Uncharacterized protein n=1 Tax=Fusarium mexicanum TaxID=751941 RepID=A0A8H5I9B8_9HYPO|nr:hypothetical protein FMEXI_12841 [Fusarium mexicanum]
MSTHSTTNQTVLDQCIIHGFGYLGSRITGLIQGTRRVQKTWKPVGSLSFTIVAIVERDPHRRATAQACHPEIPCFDDIEVALAVAAGPTTFIKDFTSPNGRERLLDLAQRAGVPVLLEKPLSSPGVKIPLRDYANIASVSMSEAFNPVVHALASKLASDAAEITSLAFARVNSLTLERLRNAGARPDIVGGAFVDKLSHDVHLLTSGILLGSTDVEFGSPQIKEMAYDLRINQDATNISFSSLNGEPLSPVNIEASQCDPSEMMVDFAMQVKLSGRPVPTRWIASWGGMPSDLAARLDIADAHVEAARMISKSDNTSYPRSNLKLIVCEYINLAGEEVQVIANLQARGAVNAWLVERRNGAEYLQPVQYSVSIIKSMEVFSQCFRTGGYLELEGIEKQTARLSKFDRVSESP